MDEIAYIMDKYNIKSIPKHNAPIVLPIIREDFGKLFYELGYTVGAEVGVWEGYFSEILYRDNPNIKKLYCVDAYQAYSGYHDFKCQSEIDRFYATAQEKLAPYPNCEFIKKFSVDAAEQIRKKSLDFVYLDAGHDFLNITKDIAAWHSKVRKGGIVSGHDYRRSVNQYECKVKDVVNAWTYAYYISPWFITSESPASWLWVIQ